MRITKADVAKKAGVSTATVSYVINGTKKLSAKTEKKVLDVIKELDYHPNMIARSMVTNRTNQIAVVVSDISNPYYSDILIAIEKAAIEKGYFVNICTGYDELPQYIDYFIDRNMDGICLLNAPESFNKQNLNKLLRFGIKVAVNGHMRFESGMISQIEPDFYGALDKIVDHLAQLGHTKIAFISEHPAEYIHDSREDAFRKAVKKYFNRDDAIVIRRNPEDLSLWLHAGLSAKRAVTEHQGITALICANDIMALGALNMLNYLNINVPQDISLVGIDNIYYSEISSPSLTTVGFDKGQYGARMFEMLYDNINGGQPSYASYDLQLYKRKSTYYAKT